MAVNDSLRFMTEVCLDNRTRVIEYLGDLKHSDRWILKAKQC